MKFESLPFEGDFDQNLDNVTWSADLETLTLSRYSFNQRLDNVTGPEGLQSLTFGANFNQSLDNVTYMARRPAKIELW